MNIAERYRKVLEEVKVAVESAGRTDGSVKLVAVSKTHPPDSIREAIEAGALIFGENKVQEGISKVTEIGPENAEWHLIGHLQKNKVRKAVKHFDVIQTVDSIELAERIERISTEEGRKDLQVFAQVDLADEKTKFGAAEDQVLELATYMSQCQNLIFAGLMAIPPFFEDAEDVRPYFRRLREIRDELRIAKIFQENGGELSMGMSHDFKIAIEEGATLVRVGTAIFGSRG